MTVSARENWLIFKIYHLKETLYEIWSDIYYTRHIYHSDIHPLMRYLRRKNEIVDISKRIKKYEKELDLLYEIQRVKNL